MGIYLVLYFVSIIFALSFYYLAKNVEKKKSERLSDISNFSVLLMLFFLAFALATNDPIEKLLTTIPEFWQFLLTTICGAFTLWKVYLNPLKERVISLEIEMASLKSEVRTNFSAIQEDLKIIKQATFKQTG